MKLNEKGFLYLETLIMIAIIGVIFVSGATIGRNFLINTLAEYESAKLIASLRFVQEQNRNSYFIREGEFKKIEPEKSMLFLVNILDNNYTIKSTPNKISPINYMAVKNVTFGKTSTFLNGIIFYPDGNPKTFGSITIKAKIGKKSANRYVIIDRAGRIRMDRYLQ